jgi:hypothetical protein
MSGGRRLAAGQIRRQVRDMREARLRPEFADLYPVVEPGVWMAASDLGRQLLLWHLTAGRAPEGERLMSQEHFEFRGGTQRNGAWVNERNERTAP